MKTNELIECLRVIVQNFDESQDTNVNKEVLYWRNKFLTSIESQMYDDIFKRFKNIFLSIPSENFNERPAESWVEFITIGLKHENKSS